MATNSSASNISNPSSLYIKFTHTKVKKDNHDISELLVTENCKLVFKRKKDCIKVNALDSNAVSNQLNEINKSLTLCFCQLEYVTTTAAVTVCHVSFLAHLK